LNYLDVNNIIEIPFVLKLIAYYLITQDNNEDCMNLLLTRKLGPSTIKTFS